MSGTEGVVDKVVGEEGKVSLIGIVDIAGWFLVVGKVDVKVGETFNTSEGKGKPKSKIDRVDVLCEVIK